MSRRYTESEKSGRKKKNVAKDFAGGFSLKSACVGQKFNNNIDFFKKLKCSFSYV